MTLDEMRLEKGRCIEQMRAIDKKYKATEAFSADDKTKYDAIEADLDTITAKIERQERLDAAEKANNEHKPGVRASLDDKGEVVRKEATPEYKRSFRAYLVGGDARTPMSIVATLTKGTPAQLGYLVPTEYETAIRKKIWPLNIMRQLASVQSTSSDSVIPVEGSLPTFGWIDELGTYPVTDVTVGRMSFGAWKLGGIIKASEELLADAFIDIGDYVGDRSKVSIAATEEAAFLIGDGNKKPTGVAVSATLGLTTASATTFTSDEVIDFMDSLPAPYEPKAQLVATKPWRSKVRKMKDTTGQYLWQPSFQAGVPDTLNGKSLNLTSYLSGLAAGNVVALYGDFSYYQILDRQGFYMRQLNELYAETGQVGFQVNERVDGMLLNADAVVKMKMAAS